MKKAKAKQKERGGLNISELAGLVDRDKGQVSRWIRRADWTFGDPPWAKSIVPGVLRWIANTLEASPARSDAAAPDDQTKVLRKAKLMQEVRKIRAQADRCETELERERGKLLDAVETRRTYLGVANRIRNGFQNLGSQLVPLALQHGMPHEAASAFQCEAEEAIAGILRILSKERIDEDGEAEAESGGARAEDGSEGAVAAGMD